MIRGSLYYERANLEFFTFGVNPPTHRVSLSFQRFSLCRREWDNEGRSVDTQCGSVHEREPEKSK